MKNGLKEIKMNNDNVKNTIFNSFNELISAVPSSNFVDALALLSNISEGVNYINGLKVFHDKILENKVKILYNNIQNNLESSKDKEKTLKKFKENSKSRKKETKLLLMALNNQIFEEKIEIYANLVFLLLTEELMVERYEYYMHLVDEMYIGDLREFIKYVDMRLDEQEFLKNVSKDIPKPGEPCGVIISYSPDQIERIRSKGLLKGSAMYTDGSFKEFIVTKHSMHFYSALKCNMSIYREYIKNN